MLFISKSIFELVYACRTDSACDALADRPALAVCCEMICTFRFNLCYYFGEPGQSLCLLGSE